MSNDKPTHEAMDMSCLIVKTEKRNILIDTGCGDGFQGSAGKLVSNLKQEGINPEDIDTIIYTHGHDLLPGVKLILAPRHTFGSMIVGINSGTDELICVDDLIHSQVEFKQPEYYSFLDSDPDKANKLRTEGLSDIAQSRMMIFACHFPFPGIGYFLQKQGILTWQPI